jgi:hypothetical protein
MSVSLSMMPPSNQALSAGMVWILGGVFRMGLGHHYPEEAPAHRVAVGGFWMDAGSGAEFLRAQEIVGSAWDRHPGVTNTAPDAGMLTCINADMATRDIRAIQGRR